MAIDPILGQAALGAGVKLIDELFTTKEEQEEAKLKLLELAHRGEIAQLEVNAQEAKHPSVFVSGWRPAVGWVCLTALALSFIVFPIAETIAVYLNAYMGMEIDLSALPVLDWQTLGPILMGMLGLGAFRTWEKVQGVARK